MPATLSDQPLISVVMPVYNAEPYLGEAITSILAQTYPHFEFIIVDDGSTDGSAGIMSVFAAQDARIRPLLCEHAGMNHTRNTGIKAAQGNLIAYMDADDIALPDRFATQIDWMRQASVDICGSCAKEFGRSDRLCWFPETHQAICYELVFRNALLHPTVMLRASIAHANLYDESLPTMGDYEMWTRLAPLYRTVNVPRVLHRWRSHPQQTHVVMKTTAQEICRKFRYRYLQTLFPQAAAGSEAVLDRVIGREPFSHLPELKQAGQWLVRLAQTQDNFLRQQMARRWEASCQRSAHLGLECYRLYQQVAPQFGLPADERARLKLWLLCALHLRPESRLHAALVSLKPNQKPWFTPDG